MVVKNEELEDLKDLETRHLDDAALDEALSDVRHRLEVIEARMEQLEQVAVRARREEHLLESLLALRRGEEPASAPVRSDNGHAAAKPDAVEATVSLLRKSGRPMHIGEIMEALRGQGVRPPGKGTQANLISHLRREPRVARPSRGMYGLVELGVKDYQPKKRRKTRRHSSGPKGSRS